MAVKLGRPPLDRTDTSVSVHVRLPSRQYDDAYQRAQAARTSIPEIIRRDLRRAQEENDDDD